MCVGVGVGQGGGHGGKRSCLVGVSYQDPMKKIQDRCTIQGKDKHTR